MTNQKNIVDNYKVNKCRICGSDKLYEFLSLDTMPIPNGFLTKEELGKPESHYPLGTFVCENCTLVQLTHVIPAEIMFRNYLYIPSTSRTMVNHFEAMANETVKQFNIRPGELVVDIGSNDGTLLKFFKANETQVLGIDPASNLAIVARLSGINTIDDFFTNHLAEKVSQEQGPAKIITATNVVAHVNNLHNFFDGVVKLLDKDGVFIGEFPYVVDMINKNEFDTIYHEHLSYFSLTALSYLFKNHNLKLLDIKKQPIHGGSIRIYVTHAESTREPTQATKQFLSEEKQAGLASRAPYTAFAQRVEKIREDLTTLIKGLKKSGKRIVGYGAAAKGNVLLNYCQIGPDLLDYIVDSVPYKQGRFTPGTHIPIFPEKRLETDLPNYVLLLAWNFADEIMRKQDSYRQRGGQFIITIPNLRVE